MSVGIEPNAEPKASTHTSTTLPDLFGLAVLGGLVLWLSAVFDGFERFVEFSERYEAWEVDEFATALLMIGLATIIFSVRRWRELSREVKRRHQVEAALTRARDELESRVAERTAELSAANAELRSQIEQRQKTDSALRQQEELYHDLYDHAPSAYLTMGPDYRISQANQRATEFLGYPQAELLGRNIFELLADTPAGRGKGKRLFQTLSAEQWIRDEEIEVKRAGRQTGWGSLTVRPFLDTAGKLTESRLMLIDVTERKQAQLALQQSEEQLRQAQKLESIGRLAGGVAHDFNNLLTAMMAHTGLALRLLSPDDPVRTNIQEIRKTADQAADLTRQLLAFARKQVVQPQIISLNQLILNIDKMLRRLIGENIELITLPVANAGRVKADPGQIEQVLINLVINARDAMPNGGTLTIETANVSLDQTYARRYAEVTAGEYVMLAVTDTGVGLPEEIKEHIFEPFFTTKEVGKGTGLGLAMVFGIIKQAGGHIAVYSEVGHGTSFKVYLPRLPEETGAEATRPLDVLAPNDLPRGNETVLLVEDEPAVRLAAAQLLTEQGYRVIEAANGEEALQLAENQRQPSIDLLLTDIVMPKLGGPQIVEPIRAMQPGIKVLFISGYPNQAVDQKGVLVGNVAFLAKPFTPDRLAYKVREVLDA
ncbi:MAG TPA: response regulator [Anaerolineae bacterium]|nr:response regulator [Anaerolineae bacterium]